MLAEKDFQALRDLLYQTCWIDLTENKKELVKARLSKRLRQLGIADYKEYVSHVLSDRSGVELTELINTLTTNLTFFFREPDHLAFLGEYLAERTRPKRRPTRPLKIWSAGCSSGEEAYSIAIQLKETLPSPDNTEFAILATDVSEKMVEAARTGVFPTHRLRDVLPLIRERYFEVMPADPARPGKWHKVRPALIDTIKFARHNLAGPWPMKGPFDAIFCRNVMIYFDKAAQQQLVVRFHDILRPGGVLIVGHAESLTGIRHDFLYARPSVYIKPEVPG